MSEVIVPLGPVASAFSAFGLAVLGRRAVGRAVRPHDRPVRPGAGRAELRRSWSSRSARGWTARACASRPSSCTARSTCATPCSWPRSPPRWPEGRWTWRPSRPPRPRSSSSTPPCTARTPGSARPASRPSRSGSAASGVLPFSPDAARDRHRLVPGPGRRADRHPSGLPGRRPGLRGHAGLRLPAAAGRAPARPGRPSSRCRPPPSSSPAAPPPPWTARQPGHAARPARGEPHADPTPPHTAGSAS